MSNGIEPPPVVSTSQFVGRRLQRFALVAVIVNLLLYLLFLIAIARTNSTQICTFVGINVQPYIEPLSREIVIGNREHLAMILDALKSSSLLKDISLNEVEVGSQAPQGKQCRFNGINMEFMMPVTFGQRQVGMLKGSVVWLPLVQILSFLGITTLFLLFFMWISTRSLLEDLHKVLINPIGKLARGQALSGPLLTSDVLKIKQDLEASRENAKYAAVAQLTQMLAHDVRKPFSMIQIVLQNIDHAQTLDEIKNIISSSSQEINRALASVTEMLTDIMEMGQDTTRSRERVSPNSLIHASLQEVCRLFPDSRITFSTAFDHQYLLEINPAKVQRVFSNIIENAVQAMEGQGQIWFQTTAPDSTGFVEVTIGNSNSEVEPDDVQRLFDAFFTKGKKAGTGLGLTIAKKIVRAHGGQIGCRVVEKTVDKAGDKKGVEFWFTLPASDEVDTADIILPTSSTQVQESIHSINSTSSPSTDEFSEHALAKTYEAEIEYKLHGRRIKVLVLDDEELYRNALIRLIQKLERITPFIDVLVAASSDEALAHAVSKPDIGLFDYDLGKTSKNGIETLKLIRQSVPSMCICIHSNHIGGSQYKEAVDGGAQYFLPKPLSKVHLLRIINNSLNVTPMQMAPTSSASRSSDTPPTLPFSMTGSDNSVVAVLDDSEFNCSAWLQMNIGQPLITFESPEMFWDYVEHHPGFFNSLAFIITDQFFDSKSALTGIEFSQTIIGKPVFLSSVGDFSHQLPIPGITGVLPKKVMKWEELHTWATSFGIGLFPNTIDFRRSLLDSIDNPQVKLKVKFLTSVDEAVNEIQIAIQQKNLQQVSELVHKLQGGASIVGAYSIANLCQQWYDYQLFERDFIVLLRDSISTLK